MRIKKICRVTGWGHHDNVPMVHVAWNHWPNSQLTHEAEVPLYFFKNQAIKVPMKIGQMFMVVERFQEVPFKVGETLYTNNKLKKCYVSELLGMDEKYIEWDRKDTILFKEEMKKLIDQL